jgi:hypothetical protein
MKDASGTDVQRDMCGGPNRIWGHTGGSTHGHCLCGHRRLRLCRVLPVRLALIVTEVTNLPLDADEVRKKGVVSIAFSAADQGARPGVRPGLPAEDRGECRRA